ncbi:chromosome partitioning protein ParB [Glycocaulis alkaliphilus]|uniref:Chromosome partitioning protein ParB n=1 Tax=Glycocaulis alkaliphilus TaxID=1434191 RepID=A0A3T0E5I2_9PROT|nr:ParB/RepB/Spo0J family partition protein [Glycocaulis alkaliphilus]AZU02631.1 chromosome partitioning protein ParB [Glycocaulis alkaliphilus]GGB80169.1 chromosome-partitioning protein ParB [Glycocaulis alkaliphilus]
MSAQERPRGLGRGLSALLGEGEDADNMRADENQSGQSAGAGPRPLALDLIEANPDQPRKRFSEDELASLSASIAERGVLQPILVRPAPGKTGHYQIVAGERRWRAAQRARLHEIPAVIREFTDRETLEIAIVENVQRQDLNAVEEARGYRQLIEAFGHTQEDVARAVGKSRAHIANTLRLLALPAPVLDHLEAGRLSAGHARAIATAGDPSALAEKIIADGLSVRGAEALARKEQAPERKARSGGLEKAQKDADTRSLEADLAERLGLDVEIIHRGEAGEIRVRYSTLEQLDDLCRRLSSR